MKKIVIVGAGGHCRSVLSVLRSPLRSQGDYEIVGISDRDSKSQGERIGEYTVNSTWADLPNLLASGVRYAAIAIGDNSERKKLFEDLGKIGFELPPMIHSSALIESDVTVGAGTLICMGVQLASQVQVGSNCVIYTGAIVDHESRLLDHSYLSPGCNLGGRVVIGAEAFVGIGAAIRERVVVGDRAIIGAGAVVLGDVEAGDRVAGVPAKSIVKKGH